MHRLHCFPVHIPHPVQHNTVYHCCILHWSILFIHSIPALKNHQCILECVICETYIFRVIPTAYFVFYFTTLPLIRLSSISVSWMKYECGVLVEQYKQYKMKSSKKN